MTTSKIEVTDHAIARYLERTGSKVVIDTARRKLLEIVQTGHQVKMSAGHQAARIISNRMAPAQYYWLNGMTAVVVDNQVVTFELHKLKYVRVVQDKPDAR